MKRKINIGEKAICSESGVVGKVIKFYYPTACEEQTMVETDDGRKYHAPTRTWYPYVDGLSPRMTIIDDVVSGIEQAFISNLNNRLDGVAQMVREGHLRVNPYDEYVSQFSKNHNITISEAMKHPMCKARLEYFNATGK